MSTLGPCVTLGRSVGRAVRFVRFQCVYLRSRSFFVGDGSSSGQDCRVVCGGLVVRGHQGIMLEHV